MIDAVAAATPLPGRMEVIAGIPPLILDAAHNPEGARALAEALPGIAQGRPVIACLSVLADKDAEGIIAPLAPLLEAAVCTEVPAEPAARVARRGSVPAGSSPGCCTPRGWRTSRSSRSPGSRSRGQGACAPAGWGGALRRIALPSRSWTGGALRAAHMMGLVAAVVAIVILVFFGLGYLFGRLPLSF